MEELGHLAQHLLPAAQADGRGRGGIAAVIGGGNHVLGDEVLIQQGLALFLLRQRQRDDPGFQLVAAWTAAIVHEEVGEGGTEIDADTPVHALLLVGGGRGHRQQAAILAPLAHAHQIGEVAAGEILHRLLAVAAELAVVISEAVDGEAVAAVFAEQIEQAPLLIADVGPEADHRQILGHEVLLLERIGAADYVLFALPEQRQAQAHLQLAADAGLQHPQLDAILQFAAAEQGAHLRLQRQQRCDRITVDQGHPLQAAVEPGVHQGLFAGHQIQLIEEQIIGGDHLDLLAVLALQLGRLKADRLQGG